MFGVFQYRGDQTVLWDGSNRISLLVSDPKHDLDQTLVELINPTVGVERRADRTVLPYIVAKHWTHIASLRNPPPSSPPPCTAPLAALYRVANKSCVLEDKKIDFFLVELVGGEGAGRVVGGEGLDRLVVRVKGVEEYHSWRVGAKLAFSSQEPFKVGTDNTVYFRKEGIFTI